MDSDDENPAVLRQTRIPPAMLEEVANDPRAAEAWNRKLYLVNIDRIQRMMKTENVPLAQRMLWAEHLAKYGGVGASAKAAAAASGPAGGGFSVNIVLNNTPQQQSLPATVTIIENPADNSGASDE